MSKTLNTRIKYLVTEETEKTVKDFLWELLGNTVFSAAHEFKNSKKKYTIEFKPSQYHKEDLWVYDGLNIIGRFVIKCDLNILYKKTRTESIKEINKILKFLKKLA